MDIALGGAVIGALGLVVGSIADRLSRRRTRRRALSTSINSPVGASESMSDELAKLGSLYERGLLTDLEFAQMKRKLIEGQPAGQTRSTSSAPAVTAIERPTSALRRVAVVAGLLAVFGLLVVGSHLLRPESDNGTIPTDTAEELAPNTARLPDYTKLQTSSFSVIVDSCDSSGASGRVTNRGVNRSFVVVAVDFFDASGVRLGGWNDQLDGINPGVTAEWFVSGGYPDVEQCVGVASSAFVTP